MGSKDDNVTPWARLYLGAATVLFGIMGGAILIIYNLALERLGKAEKELFSIQVERLPSLDRRISLLERDAK